MPWHHIKLVCDPNCGFIPLKKASDNVALYGIMKAQGGKIDVDIPSITVGASSTPSTPP